MASGFLAVVFTFFFVDFFDATGTLVALANKSGYLDADGNMPRATAAFSCDGLAAVCGAFLGTSTTTAYIESASGIEEGGRTGLVAVTRGRSLHTLDGLLAHRRGDSGGPRPHRR